MKTFVSLGSFALALIPAAALAQQPAACERVEFSQEVLARFPNIRSACLDVINRDGQSFAVVRANLVRVTPRRMTVRVQLPDGTQSDTMGINVASNARVNIEGRMVPVRDLAVGQTISAYINVNDPGIAVASEDSGPVEFTPIAAEPEPAPEPVAEAAPAPAPEMPKTASNLPLAGSIGLALLALGAGLAFLRRRARA
jgi:LPXTG-motif cell wall-anchored protein